MRPALPAGHPGERRIGTLSEVRSMRRAFGLALLLLFATVARIDIDTDDDDGGCVLGLPMCRGIGSGAGDPIWGD